MLRHLKQTTKPTGPDEKLGKQANKSRRTQQKIIEVVKDLMYEGGFAAASSTRIARLAGVSWGVVQHHFGDKQGILLAVLEQCQQDYITFMSATPVPTGSRSSRIEAFVQRFWEFLCRKEYRITLEIAFAMRFQDNRPFAGMESLRSQLAELWRSIYPDTDVEDETLGHLIRHTYIVLSGLAIDEMLEGGDQNSRVQLQMLCATLEAQLYGNDAEGEREAKPGSRKTS